jgi:CarD family transcriptional regulator
MAHKKKSNVKTRAGKPVAPIVKKAPPRAASAKVDRARSNSAKPVSRKLAPTTPVGKPTVAKAKAIFAKAKPEVKPIEVKKPAVEAMKAAEQRKMVGIDHAKAAAVQAVAAAAAPAVTGRAVPASLTKAAGTKITAPIARAAPAQAMTPKSIAEKTAARQIMNAQRKPVSQRHGFKTNEFIVYPAHGVGRIIGIEEQEIAGMSLELFVINFDKEKLTLRVPTGKLSSVGMRKLADENLVKKAIETLKGRARVKRTMWSRRAQEYVAKINSGDLISIAEVVRDLYRSEAQPEQSYSERQLYEDALDRMAREIAAVEKLDDRGAVQRITEVLSKSARGRRLAEEGEIPAEVKAA